MSFTYNEQTPLPISEVDSEFFSNISDECLPMAHKWNTHDKPNINDIDLGNDQDQAMEQCNDNIEREMNCITDCISIHDILCKSNNERICPLQQIDKQAKPIKDNSYCDEREAIENSPDFLEQTEIPARTKLSRAPSDGWNRLEGATLRNISFRHVFDRENEAKSENKTNKPNKIDATLSCGGLNHQHIENKRFRKPTHNLKGDYNKSNKNDSNIVNKPNKADVVFGRGGLANNHTGNKRFRTLVYDHKDEYDKSSKKSKTTISQSVVDAITSDGGRFLRRDKSTCTWLTVDNSEARRKTSQALRDASIFNTCEGKTETNEI